MCRFSIIVPVYKVEPYLVECLESVWSQDFTDWECICVNDGSPDGCGKILDDYAAKDSRFRAVYHRNVGLPGARNRALDVVRGEYVIFLDSDDILAHGILRYVANCLKADEVDAVVWQHQTFHSGDAPTCKVTSLSLRAAQARRYTGRLLLEYLITHKIMYGFVWLFCIRRSCIGAVRFRPVEYVEDMMFVADMASEIHSLMVTEGCGLWYRRREGQITAICSMKSYLAQQQGWIHAFRRYGALCVGSDTYKLLVATVQGCLMQNTIALCCYTETSGIRVALRDFFRAHPELVPKLKSLKAVLCRLVATPGVSVPVRMGLRVVGRVLMYARQRRE